MRLLRMLGIGLGMLLAVGFGLCGVFGVSGGVATMRAGGGWSSLAFLLPGLAGLGIGWVFVGIVRLAMSDKPDADRPPKK